MHDTSTKLKPTVAGSELISVEASDRASAFTISDVIRKRIMVAGAPFVANSNISEFLHPGDKELLIEELTQAVYGVLDTLVVDTENDHNTQGTAKRVAKMMVNELFSGRYDPQPSITDFPNASDLDELYVVGPIEITSTCSHHFVPITGMAWVGVQPSDRVIGLSKFHRLAGWIMRRPQIQEEATVMLADAIEKAIAPEGLIVIVKAKHMCCGIRGVRDSGTWMTTSVIRGSVRNNPTVKMEFLKLVELSQ